MSDEAITVHTLEAAQALAALRFDERQRAQMLPLLEQEVARFVARRAHPLPNALNPAAAFDPRLPGEVFDARGAPLVLSEEAPPPCPGDDADIAFAPLRWLGAWLRRGDLTSVRLTSIYLDRLRRIGPTLECVITLTPELAMAQAARADEELFAGRDRGPLHGIPWGAKDLLDTAGIATTWGATPYRDRVPDEDAAVVRRLRDAGAVLVAKLTLGALAYGDVWFAGRTRNPWNIAEGSSGSSAGSASAVAAGLVGFAIGTETMGSIVSPCMRCGATGLRPTFGRVSRRGAMALCWSLDKIGPIARRVEDTALVLDALNGQDPGDPGSLQMPFDYDASASVSGLTLGYDPAWLEHEAADPLDAAAIELLRDSGVRVQALSLPPLPYDALWTALRVEAAAAFEELTLGGGDATLVRQDAAAWPNLFRVARLIPAVDYLQAERLRRQVMEAMAGIHRRVDALIGPSFVPPVQIVTNMTGQPSLTLRTGFVERPTRAEITAIGATPRARPAPGEPLHRVPHGITLWGRRYDEGALLRLGLELERAAGVWDQRPPTG